MKIAIIGYGKMGKTIEKVAIERGHEVFVKIDSNDFSSSEIAGADVAIEFTQPDVAFSNIKKCYEANVPVVVGTTAWYDDYEEARSIAISANNTLFTATNFSIGVNILFHINEKLSAIMNGFPDYDVAMDETHHLEKKDHPSGTAVTLANGVLNSLDRKKKYIGLLEGQDAKTTSFDLQILSRRRKDVPGYHQVKYESKIDEITISHNAKSRLGFAQGAVLAAEWVQDRKGVFGMKDLLNFG